MIKKNKLKPRIKKTNGFEIKIKNFSDMTGNITPVLNCKSKDMV